MKRKDWALLFVLLLIFASAIAAVVALIPQAGPPQPVETVSTKVVKHNVGYVDADGNITMGNRPEDAVWMIEAEVVIGEVNVPIDAEVTLPLGDSYQVISVPFGLGESATVKVTYLGPKTPDLQF